MNSLNPIKLSSGDKVFVKGIKSNIWTVRYRDKKLSRVFNSDFYIIDELPYALKISHRETRSEAITNLYILSSKKNTKEELDVFNNEDYEITFNGMILNKRKEHKPVDLQYMINQRMIFEYKGDDDIVQQEVEIISIDFTKNLVTFNANTQHWEGLTKERIEEIKKDPILMVRYTKGLKKMTKPMSDFYVYFH